MPIRTPFNPTLTRRAFATSLVAGFALAARPLRAAPLTTPSEGQRAGEVSIPTPSGPIPGYRAVKNGAVDAPVLLVIQEIFGVHEHIRDVCRRFAREGFYAIAPSLYHRHGDPGAYEEIGRLVQELVARVPDAEVLADLDATAVFARTDGGGPRRCATGFCWGGRIVWLYAAHQPALAAGVAWYGRLRGVADPLHPKHPLDVVSELRAPVLGLYGGQDTGIPLSDVDAMRAALGTAGRKGRIDVFPDAPHAFFADYRPSYREAEAVDAFGRCLRFLREPG